MAKHEGINRNYEKGVWTGVEDEGPTDAERKIERDKLMQEFLAKGKKIEKLAPGIAKGGIGTWNRNGKPSWTDAEIKAKWKAEQENGSENTKDTGWDFQSAEQ